MKKIILSSLAALTLSTSAMAGEPTSVFAKADKLKFSGLTYIGYTYNDFKNGETSKPGTNYADDESNFELRRAYFQLKAYLLDDPKSYYRVTFDMHQNAESDMVVRAKYAYLYLNAILPATGVEMGLVHRPWHDYEEHNAWYFRNISKVLIEAKNGADLSNSADFGVNFKTKTEYIDTEIGVFNGEGYHSDQNDDEASQGNGVGMSLEWRATAHLLGVSGKDKQNTKTYFDASFFGQYNVNHKGVDTTSNGTSDRYDDLVFGGIHTVFNMPSFLVSAQYILSDDTAKDSSYVSAQAGAGYSVNGEFRLGNEKEYRVLGRYDSWTPKDKEAQNAYIAGAAWDQSKNVQWVANAIVTDNKAGSSREKYNGVAYMLTAEVKF